MNCKICNKIFEGKNKKNLIRHEKNCKGITKCLICNKDIRYRYERHVESCKKKKFRGLGQGWSKGKTKENCETIKNISESLKLNWIKNPKIGYKHTEESKAKMKLTNGGIRKGGGRGKKGKYKGMWCDSSYELAYLIYCFDHNIKIYRNTIGFNYKFEDSDFKWYPDFLLEDGTFVEIKGFINPKTQSKFDYFTKPLIILYKETIEPYLEYAKSKYGENFIRLYE